MESETSVTRRVGDYIEKLKQGDSRARDAIMEIACERLVQLTHRMLNEFPAVKRWEQTDDVAQKAFMRLFKALGETPLNDPLHFFRLAAEQIRRELIDLANHYRGPLGIGANHHTQRKNSQSASVSSSGLDLAALARDSSSSSEGADLLEEFHLKVSQLDERDRELFDLLWYHDLPITEVADLLHISERQLRRRWRQAKHNVSLAMGIIPDSDDLA